MSAPTPGPPAPALSLIAAPAPGPAALVMAPATMGIIIIAVRTFTMIIVMAMVMVTVMVSPEPVIVILAGPEPPTSWAQTGCRCGSTSDGSCMIVYIRLSCHSKRGPGQGRRRGSFDAGKVDRLKTWRGSDKGERLDQEDDTVTHSGV